MATNIEKYIYIGQQFQPFMNILIVYLQENTLEFVHWHLVYLI